MDLIRWKSGRHSSALSSLRREFNDLFDRFWSGQVEPMQLGRWAPAVDISETEEAVLVQAEVPGLEADEIEVLVEGNVLTLKGEKKDVREETGDTYHRVERQYGTFIRSIPLPSPVVSDKAEASFRNGVLEVRLPKSEEARPKHVTVDVKK
jgi:HSP20 family protein